MLPQPRRRDGGIFHFRHRSRSSFRRRNSRRRSARRRSRRSSLRERTGVRFREGPAVGLDRKASQPPAALRKHGHRRARCMNIQSDVAFQGWYLLSLATLGSPTRGSPTPSGASCLSVRSRADARGGAVHLARALGYRHHAPMMLVGLLKNAARISYPQEARPSRPWPRMMTIALKYSVNIAIFPSRRMNSAT
jgi:hypothetical protein